MADFNMSVNVPLRTFKCRNKDCCSEFSVILVIRPSEEYLQEEPSATGTTTNWDSDSDYRPYCPSCGQKVEKEKHEKN